MSSLFLHRPLILLLTFFLAACAAPGSALMAHDETSAPSLAWPPPPAPARILYVGSVNRPEDLGISRTLFQRFKDLIFGEMDNRLVRPMAVLAGDHALYVADPGAKGVHRFDTAEGQYRLIIAAGEQALPSPVGLTRAAGAVLVADSRLAEIFRIRPGDEVAAPLGLHAQLVQPTGLAYDPETRHLYVVDTGAHCIKVFDPQGQLVETIGRRGASPGEFNYPAALWRDRSGTLYVNDALNFRIQHLDAHGRYLGGFGRPGDSAGDTPRQKGVAVDRFHHLYVADGVFHALQIFDTEGTYLLSVGSRGNGAGEFWLPAGIDIDDEDRIYVADSYNRRVQIFRYVGGDA